jgi:hypothetical protein
MTKGLKYLLFSAVSSVVILLTGCEIPHLAKSELLYQPAGTASSLKVPARLVVAPLDMPPYNKIEIDPPFFDDGEGYLSISPRRFSQWFAQELEQQKAFLSVRYQDWDKVAEDLDNTDIIVTGEIKQLRMLSGHAGIMALPPQGILLLIGLLPAPVVRHDFTLELKAFTVGNTDRPFWTKSISINDPKAGWKFIWQPICKTSIRTDDCLFLRQEELLAPVFKTWAEDLIKVSLAQNFQNREVKP